MGVEVDGPPRTDHCSGGSCGHDAKTSPAGSNHGPTGTALMSEIDSALDLFSISRCPDRNPRHAWHGNQTSEDPVTVPEQVHALRGNRESAENLRDYVLPEGVLPLAPTRQPFTKFGIDALELGAGWALAFPEKQGRLSSCVRELMNISSETIQDYVVYEAHIDISEAPLDLADEFVRLGFEPDNFFKLQPICYKAHFTLAFKCRKQSRERQRQVMKILERSVNQAKCIIQNDSRVSAFIEVEAYGSRNVQTWSEFKPVTQTQLEQYPYDCLKMEAYHLPSTEVESLKMNMSLNAFKAFDVHVKLPSACRGGLFADADAPPMLGLRSVLQESGFYEIVSEAGNHIFTAQFIDANDTKQIFTAITNYARQCGGFSGIYMERCIDFWRKSNLVNGCETLAEISPLVKLVS